MAVAADSGNPGTRPARLAHDRLLERLEVDRREAPLAGTPVGLALHELRAGEGKHEERKGPAPLDEMVDEWRAGRRRRGEGPRRRGRPCPGQRSARRTCARRRRAAPEPPSLPRSEQGQEGRLEPALLGLVGHPLADHRSDAGPGRRLVVRLEEARSLADHLAEGPERDPVSVRGAAAHVPPGVLDETVGVLGELPGEATLPDPRPRRPRRGVDAARARWRGAAP